MRRMLLGISLSAISCFSFAMNWQVVNEDSKVSFISIKKGDVAEVHRFNQLEGQLKSGAFTLSIPLTSVWTNVEIRDIRMKEILFETAQYPNLTLKAELDDAAVESLAVGSIMPMSLQTEIALHGQSKTMAVHVKVAKLATDKLFVVSDVPLLINAADFGLTEGVEKLREIAGLTTISQAVPVSFVLTLKR
ncbi:hypothetical protein TUM3794_36630 [Shewanella colwelliana]|uniref:Lipid/polyisoprenoid-binding YceI-like domain-containing protein n=1 Tax=Shewanella colwelliana TaxID=23 RepID=A0ABQ4PDX9_SHECO|nr:YceI family protein [Shewanella colwelliana]GIU45711.1 hypothetical protein TUM3794_36630 [Shewanella colwelliana]